MAMEESKVTKMKTINVTDAQHHMLQVLVMFAHENEVPEQEGWNIQTYNLSLLWCNDQPFYKLLTTLVYNP